MKTNEKEKFYGVHLTHMETVKDKAVIIAKFAAEFSGAKTSRIVSRIKSPESMEKKILADGLPVNYQDDIRLIEKKDYIKNPKPSGYRSLHVILGITSDDEVFPEMKVEVQIRTSVMDCWASLEHLAQYKQVISLTPEVLDTLDTYRQAADREIQAMYA